MRNRVAHGYFDINLDMVGELLSLSWADVDLDKRVVLLRDTKNGNTRQAPLSTAVVNALEPLSCNKDVPRVFWNWKASDSIQATWRRAVNGPHSLDGEKRFTAL